MANEPEPEITNETPSKEDYEAIKAELEAERQKAEGLVAEAIQPLQERITTLETEVTTRTQELNELKELNQLKEQEFEGAKAAYAYALEDFKNLAASANPLLPAEVITGTTVEEVKASLDRANKLVSSVQASLAKQAAAVVVPAGAPVRSPASTEGLSTKEKINLGLEQARRKKES